MQDVPPGQYRMAVGMYNPDSGARLPIVDAAGDRQPEGALVLPEEVDW
jgi:hypothetical protein